MRNVLIIISLINCFGLLAQNDSQNLIQLSLNNSILQNHFSSQELFNKEKQLTYQAEESFIEEVSFKFGDLQIQKYDLSLPQNVEVSSVNFEFEKVIVNG